jgi:hypothetical protein
MHDLLDVALIEMRVLRQDALHELDLIIVASSRAQLGNLEPISCQRLGRVRESAEGRRSSRSDRTRQPVTLVGVFYLSRRELERPHGGDSSRAIKHHWDELFDLRAPQHKLNPLIRRRQHNLATVVRDRPGAERQHTDTARGQKIHLRQVNNDGALGVSHRIERTFDSFSAGAIEPTTKYDVGDATFQILNPHFHDLVSANPLHYWASIAPGPAHRPSQRPKHVPGRRGYRGGATQWANLTVVVFAWKGPRKSACNLDDCQVATVLMRIRPNIGHEHLDKLGCIGPIVW